MKRNRRPIDLDGWGFAFFIALCILVVVLFVVWITQR